MNDVHKGARPGDKVRFYGHAFRGQEGVWVSDDLVIVGGTAVVNPHEYQVVQADDPSNDLLGTLRREEHDEAYMAAPGVSIWQATQDSSNRRQWLCTYSTASGNRGESAGDWEVAGFPVIGTQPGTPAWEREQADVEHTDEEQVTRSLLVHPHVWRSLLSYLDGTGVEVEELLVAGVPQVPPLYEMRLADGEEWPS